MIKILKGLDNAVFNEDIVFDPGVTYFSDVMGLDVDLSLDDDNFNDDDPGTIIHIRLMT